MNPLSVLFRADFREHDRTGSIVWGSYGVGRDLYPTGEEPTERRTGACPAKCLFYVVLWEGACPCVGANNHKTSGEEVNRGLSD